MGGEPIGHLKLLTDVLVSGGTSLSYEVPDDVRWIIKYGYVQRSTAATFALWILKEDASTPIAHLLQVASGTTHVAIGPTGNCEDPHYYPVEIPAHAVLQLKWGAAQSAGACTSELMIKEFKVFEKDQSGNWTL